MDGDPGAAEPQDPIPAIILKKEMDNGPQTTGMTISGTLTPSPSIPGRHRCSWPGPLFKGLLTPQHHLLQAPGLRDVICSTQGPSPTTLPLIKFCIEGLELRC